MLVMKKKDGVLATKIYKKTTPNVIQITNFATRNNKNKVLL